MVTNLTSLQLIRQLIVFYRAKRVTFVVFMSFYQQSERNKHTGLIYHTIKRKVVLDVNTVSTGKQIPTFVRS